MAARIPAEERLTNLVVALMATEIGLTKQQILASVSGYRQRADGRQDALEKMFERDKEDLRALGIPIETLGDHADPNDLREARYRIPKAEYDLPVDIEFTSAELAVLRLAGSVWSEESLSGDAQAGVRKIRALGIDVDEPIIGFAPRITARDAAFAPLQGAIERSVAVAFDYLKPGEEAPRRRRVQPLALVEYEARWHVFGRDVDADGDRMFLLTRIVGDVVVDLRRLPAPSCARARASARSRAWRRSPRRIPRCSRSRRAPRPRCVSAVARQPAVQGIRLPYVDLHILADELASYGPEVRVVEPAPLRAAVIDAAARRGTNCPRRRRHEKGGA